MRSRSLVLMATMLLAAHASTSAQIASGGPYTLEKAVIAGGGGQASGGAFGVEKTIGQAIAGTTSSGGGYSLASGFWTAGPLAPTAANASISGRVTDRSGRGVSQAVVYLAGGTLTTPRIVTTNTFGRFTVRDVPVGQFYILSVKHRRYTFSPDNHAFDLVDDLDGISFRADGRP